MSEGRGTGFQARLMRCRCCYGWQYDWRRLLSYKSFFCMTSLVFLAGPWLITVFIPYLMINTKVVVGSSH